MHDVWLIHYDYESPHKGRSTRMCVCTWGIRPWAIKWLRSFLILSQLIFRRIFFIVKPLKNGARCNASMNACTGACVRLKSRRQEDHYRRWLKPEVCPFRSCKGRPSRPRGAWESIFPARKPLTTKTFHHIKDVGAPRFTFNYMSVSREPKHPHYRVHELFSRKLSLPP